MGCLLPRNDQEIVARGKALNKKLSDEEEAPLPNYDELKNKTVDSDKYSDIEQKKELAKFLLNNDIKIFKRHLDEVMNLKNEDFYELFEGNTEFSYNTQNKREFKQLAQKFDDNKDLTIEYYNKTEYYEAVLSIWKPNILYKLKTAGNEKEQNNILTKYKINTSSWDDNFEEYLRNILNYKPVKTLAQRAKNYIEDNYGDFDELIKCVTHCKNKVENGEKTHCNKKLCINLDSATEKIVGEFIPHFMKQIGQGVINLDFDYRKKEMQNAIKKIKTSKLTKSEEKELINEVLKIYKINNDKEEEEQKIKKMKEDKEKENKKNEKDKNNEIKPNEIIDSILENNSECEKLKDLSIKFNNASDNKIHFNKLNLKDKIGAVFSNKMIKNAILGISLSNVSYSVLNLTKTIMSEQSYDLEFSSRLDKIRNNFIAHQNEVKYIDEDDIDNAIEQTIECGKKFNSDLADVEELISDIKKGIDEFQNGKKISIGGMVKSGISFLLSLIGIGVTEGEDKVKYAISAVSNAVSVVGSGIDFAVHDKAIKELIIYIQDAKKLKKQIIDEINKLRNKFQEISNKHY